MSTCKGPRVLSRSRQRVQSSARTLLTSVSTVTAVLSDLVPNPTT
jgi:hypothetical protein